MQTENIQNPRTSENMPFLRARIEKNVFLTIKDVKELHRFRKKFPKMKILAR